MHRQRARHRATRRHGRQLAVVLAAGLAALVAVILGLSAALDVYWDPHSSVTTALASVWVVQTLTTLSRRPVRDRPGRHRMRQRRVI